MNPELDPERSLLTAALHRPSVVEQVEVASSDFASPNNRALWQLINRLHDSGEGVTATVVVAKLSEVRDIAPGITPAYVADLYTGDGMPALAGKYARLVANEAGNRRLMAAGQRAIQLAQAGGNAHESQEIIRAEIDGATREVTEALFLGETIDETLEALENPTTSIPTPWTELNRLIRGWRPGALYTVGARPGIGKTILGVQAALGLGEHGSVAFASLEMPRQELETRVIAQTAEVPLGRMDGSGDGAAPLTARDWDRIGHQRELWSRLGLSVTDKSAMTLTDIKSHARSIARRRPLTAIVVDYLQLLEPTRDQANRPRYEIVTGFSRALKIMAREFNVPVIALAQLNRESVKDRRPPTLADLRDSGAIEQDSDVVMLMHGPDELGDNVDVMVAKNRHGIRGVAELSRRGEFARIESRPTWQYSNTPPPAYADN